MTGFILRRILQSIAVMLTVAFVAFALFNFVGDPVTSMAGEGATAQSRADLRHSLGLDDPFVVQYGHFLMRALRGDFGISYQYARPVFDLILARLPATLELSLAATVYALVAGVVLGVYTALRRDSWLSQILIALSLLGVSLPAFFVGILLILVFSVTLNWLPSFGRGATVDLGWWTTGMLTLDGLRALVLPAVMLGMFPMALILRLVRGEMLEVLRTDYIKFARARGLPRRVINFGHALKNTLVPVVTVTGLQIGSIIAFSIITETVFQWPGTGLMIIEAISFADVPMMSAYLVLVAFLFVFVNLMVDLLYYVVDPRLRTEGSIDGRRAW